MLVAIRLKGQLKVRKEIQDTMDMLGIKKKLSMAVLKEEPQIIGMLKKSKDFIAWGELSDELEKEFSGKKTVQLKPPKGGFKSMKQKYPRGDLGHWGKEINVLIKRMM
jgi:ribosomal protein L30/L7E